MVNANNTIFNITSISVRDIAKPAILKLYNFMSPMSIITTYVINN